MLKKLLNLFPTSIYTDKQPTKDELKDYDWFFEEDKEGWVGLKKNSLETKQKVLLETLFTTYLPSVIENRFQNWYNFLYSDGPLPTVKTDHRVRIIHLSCSGTDWEQKDLELALKGFLSEEIIIIWESSKRAILIENESNTSLKDDDFQSISETFENDLYLRVSFYIGKFYPITVEHKQLFLQNRALFQASLETMPRERVYSFEKVFPTILARSLPSNLLQAIQLQILLLMGEDPETLTTVQVYLENNLNASVTAKKLYIHRNTLQYRLDKFTEKTEINLKDFPSTLTLYIACLLQTQKNM